MFCWLVEWHGCPRYFWFCCLSVDEKNGFAPICSLQTMSQICKNGGVNMGQRWQMPRYLHHPVFWYPYYFFTPPFLQVCDKLARSKFVQIRFQSSVLKTASRHFATPPLVSPWNVNWVVTHHQGGICALLPQVFFRKETNAGCFRRLLV